VNAAQTSSMTVRIGALGILFVSCGTGSGAPTDAPRGSDASVLEGGPEEGGSMQEGSSESAAASDSAGPTDAGAASDAGDESGDGGDAAVTGGGACKRGMASNTAASAGLSPGIGWWYDWSNAAPKTPAPAAGIVFVPMIWGSADLLGPIPAGSTHVLGFNEPNFKAQANLTPAQAAADWPQVEMLARAQGIPLVSPAVNFCGSASNTSGCSDPTITDPYTWLKDFFLACTGCEVDAVAVHWYNCDLPSLRAYIDGNVDAGGTLQGFLQFGKPVWLTEFSCDATHTVADQTAYMQKAVPYLESNAHVARYAWFSASPIPNALLEAPDGAVTALGALYASLPGACQ
jgi:hypothetical protein